MSIRNHSGGHVFAMLNNANSGVNSFKVITLACPIHPAIRLNRT